MTDIDPELVKFLFERIIPFNRHLGMTLERIEDGLVELKLPFRPEFIGNPVPPTLHGGVVSTLLDTTGGACVWSRVTVADRVSTVDLRVDYLRPGRAEDIVARGKVVRLGNRVGVAELRAYHPGAEDKPIAWGMGVYNVRRSEGADPDALWDKVRRAAESQK